MRAYNVSSLSIVAAALAVAAHAFGDVLNFLLHGQTMRPPMEAAS
ncbi:MAG: hypothetical protein WAV78_28235 [Xanthobacteraceae bacterium]|jgi:hypothetical protein